MKHRILATIAITCLLPSEASACMGVDFFFFPIAGLGFAGFLLFVGVRMTKKESFISESVDALAISITAPLALAGSATAMQVTGAPGGVWKCSFSDHPLGQFTAHIAAPLFLSALAVLFYTRKREFEDRPSLYSISVWIVLGLWGIALATGAASIVNRSGTPSFWRSLHYLNILALCVSGFVMPLLEKRVHSLLGISAILLAFLVTGITFGIFL